ncbi:MAG: response regulator transcription factor [Firmicutes bacterium]|nr:response regulator transcription factor [Bacillota bacterium]
MKLRAIIVDDEPRAREVLRHFLNKRPEIKVVGEGGSGEEALELVQEHHPEVVFLDVKMPGMDGLSAARLISKLDDPPLFVFTTAYEEHAVGAFEVEAVDYLVKPYTTQRINAAVDRVLNRFQSQYQQAKILDDIVKLFKAGVPRRLSFEIIGADGEKSSIFIAEDSILFAEARGRHTRIVTDEGEYDVNANLGEVFQWLSPKLFFKSHRSYLVNMERVAEIKVTGRTYGILLRGGKKYGLIPLSRGRVDELKEILSKNGK